MMNDTTQTPEEFEVRHGCISAIEVHSPSTKQGNKKRATCRDVSATLNFRSDGTHPSGEKLVLCTEWQITRKGEQIMDGTWRSLKSAFLEDVKPEDREQCAETLRSLADWLDQLDTPNTQ